jgi:hypothetical protein
VGWKLLTEIDGVAQEETDGARAAAHLAQI